VKAIPLLPETNRLPKPGSEVSAAPEGQYLWHVAHRGVHVPPQLEQIVPGVHRLTDGVVNLYLVEAGGRLTVLDTGWPRSWRTLEAALSSLGRDVADIDGVLLTHGHGDHMGTAERLRRRSGAPVRCSAAEQDRVRGRSGRPITLVPRLLPHLLERGTIGFILHATVRGFLTPARVDRVEPFALGEPLALPGRPVPIGTPGHTEGHTSFLLAEHGVLVSGDALVTMDPRTRVRGPRVATPELCSDYDAAIRSLDALEPLEATVLLSGHGEPFLGSPADAVAQARQAVR